MISIGLKHEELVFEIIKAEENLRFSKDLVMKSSSFECEDIQKIEFCLECIPSREVEDKITIKRNDFSFVVILIDN